MSLVLPTKTSLGIKTATRMLLGTPTLTHKLNRPHSHMPSANILHFTHAKQLRAGEQVGVQFLSFLEEENSTYLNWYTVNIL